MKKVNKYKIAVLGVVLGGLSFVGSAGASESYQTESEVQFTFNETMSIALKDGSNCNSVLSSPAFNIANLSPGTSGTSNAICIDVSTNNASGYKVLGSVGSSGNASNALKHSNGTSTLTSVATNANLTSLTSGTWGYAISSNGTSYGKYNGLAAYTSANNGAQIIASSNGAVSSAKTYMRIGAYAATGQVAGDYTNTINLYVVPYVSS